MSALRTEHRIEIVRVLVELCAGQAISMIIQATRPVLLVVENLFSENVAHQLDTVPWFDQLVRQGLCVLEDEKTVNAVVLALLPILTALVTKGATWAGNASVLESLRALVVRHPFVVQTMRGPFVNSVLTALVRDDTGTLPRPVRVWWSWW